MHTPAQRRPRADRACNACRTAKQRCEPIEYGKNDRSCRRCVSQGLDCSLPREARSQSPASAFGVQGSASSGTSGNLTSGAEPGVQYMLRQSEPPRFPGINLPPETLSQSPASTFGVQGAASCGTSGNLTSGAPGIQYTPRQSEPPSFPAASGTLPRARSEEPQGQDAGICDPAQGSLDVPDYYPLAPSMHSHAPNLPNVSQEGMTPEYYYYPQHYYGQGASSTNAYVPQYATRGAPTNVQDLCLVGELEPYDAGSSTDKDDAGPSDAEES